MPGAEYPLLAAAVTNAFESNTDRRYPQNILDEVRQIARHAEGSGSSVSLALLKRTDPLEFEVEMSILLTRRLPKHLWGFVTGLINEISGPLEDGVGFEAHGGKAAVFEDILAAVEEAEPTTNTEFTGRGGPAVA
ncbi:hypothetical protein DFH06DRAFT_1320181 [Mycena polygramma]|nr:hypothetical protein DFH06DRAFT_1320181 [Mycena polygramma]